MKYRKKPVVIEAIQWNGQNHREMFDFLTNYEKTNEYMSASGENFYIDHEKVSGGLIIKTLEGEHIAAIGDYIIKGVKGEFYPCKPDIFEQTYEKVGKRVTPKHIIKALQCCYLDEECNLCPNDRRNRNDCCDATRKGYIQCAIYLIKHQQKEIQTQKERLHNRKAEVDRLNSKIRSLKQQIELNRSRIFYDEERIKDLEDGNKIEVAMLKQNLEEAHIDIREKQQEIDRLTAIRNGDFCLKTDELLKKAKEKGFLDGIDFSLLMQDMLISEDGYVIDTGNYECVNAEVALRLAEKIKKHPVLWKLFFMVA